MWDSRLRKALSQAGYTRLYLAIGSSEARTSERAAHKVERQAHRRLLSKATHNSAILAKVYGW